MTPLLEVERLEKFFDVSAGTLHAVDGVSFKINQGETLGVVGESGCGKSTTGRSILRLIEPTSGEVIFNGENIVNKNREQMRLLRREMQLIFQDPYASLDPRKTVSEIIGEPLKLQKLVPDKDKRAERVHELMEVVGLADRLVNTYPHELDGGRRQRIGIGRALILEPEFIVCDEPVSALDVSIQAQVINLLLDIQRDMKLTYIFVTHDLSVAKFISTNIMVMYLGQVVEFASAKELFDHPVHPYSKALLSAIPNLDIDQESRRIPIQGEVTSPINPKRRCRFATRCRYAKETCMDSEPVLKEYSPGHFVSCFYAEELDQDKKRV